MQDKNTFITSAQYSDTFDFATVWRIPSGGGYPVHQWEEPLDSALAVADLFPGSGTDADPYVISTAQQLRDMIVARQIDSTAWNAGKVYSISANIDMAGNETPIFGDSSLSNYFRGKFLGNNFTISNITINAPSKNYVGFFGYLYNATIQDLNLTVTSVTGSAYVGTLAGYATATSQISNVHVTGVALDGSSSVTASASDSRVGGLIGNSNCSIDLSSVSRLTITGLQHTGGLVGYAYGSGATLELTNSAVKDQVTVSGTTRVGGLVGTAQGTSPAYVIRRSYSKANVIGTGSGIGGFAGYTEYTTIYDSYSQGSVNAGLAATQGNIVGGFLGSSYISNIHHSYAASNVCDGACTAANAGPFNGSSAAITSTSIYWDNQVSGWSSSNSGIGKTTVQLQDKNTFITSTLYSDTFNFANVWRIPSGGGYPVHQWEEPLDSALAVADLFPGSGTDADPYVISTAQQLRDMIVARQIDSTAWNAGKVYSVSANIDMAGNETPIIGESASSNQFKGKFLGNNFTISNITIDAPAKSNVGLFGAISSGIVQDLNLTVVSVTGLSNVGTLAGFMTGSSTISNVHVTGAAGDGSSTISGTATSNTYVGGLIGNSYGTVTQSSANLLTVSGPQGIGGVFGRASGIFTSAEITYCAANMVTVTGAVNIGGFAGHAMGNQYTGNSVIRYSYSKANVIGTNLRFGGFVGYMEYANIFNSYTQSTINTGPAAASQGNYIGGFTGSATSSNIQYSFASANVCDGDCTAATNAGPFSAISVASTENFWIAEDSGWATAGTGIGTMTTAADFSTDGDLNGIVDALDGSTWDDTYWQLDPAITLGYPELQWVLP